MRRIIKMICFGQFIFCTLGLRYKMFCKMRFSFKGNKYERNVQKVF